MADQIEGTTAVEPSGPEATEQTAAPEAGSGGNPAWAELRSSLGDSTFTLIRPHLEKFDQAANQRITSLNDQVKQYSALGDVQTLQQYQTLAQQLDSNPKDFYDRLQAALTERGLLEQAAAVQQEAEELEDGEDPRFAQLQQEQQRIQEMLEQQDLERQTAQQSSILQTQIASTRQANQWMSDADEKQVVSMAHAKVLDGSAQTIEQAMQRATAEYTEIRNRFLSTPRAGESAPKLPSVGGGNPSTGAVTQDLAKATRGQTQDFVTAYLKAAQG